MSDQLIKKHHEVFKADHAQGRDQLLTQLQEEPLPVIRRRWMPAVPGIAAVICIGVLVWLLISLQGAQLSWAQVSAQLRAIKSASYHYTTSIKHSDGRVTSISRDVVLRFSGQLRNSSNPSTQPGDSAEQSTNQTTSWIIDPTGHPGTTIYFAPDSPNVGVTENVFVGTPATPVYDQDTWLTRLRAMDDKRIVRKGEEMLDARKVIRFEQPMNEVDAIVPGGMTVWVDATSGLPVRTLERESVNVDGKTEIHTVQLDHLQFDPPLDDGPFAWPDLKNKRVDQGVVVHVAPGTTQKTLSLKIITEDGQELSGPADFGKPISSPDHGGQGLLWELELPAMKRVAVFTKDHIGQKLLMQVSPTQVQPVEILGSFIFVSAKSSVAETAPASMPSPKP